VNEHFQTNIENIYAAGDVIGFPALASTSMEQARRAVGHALGLAGSAISPLLPNGIYTIPEVGMVETEESLKKKGVAYIVGRANYRENARGRIIGDLDGFLKLLFRQDDLKLIGVHIMGDLATECCAHRTGGNDVQCLRESLCRRLLKYADSRSALQNRDAERAPKHPAFGVACLIK